MLCRTIILDFKNHTLLWLRGVYVCVKYNIIFFEVIIIYDQKDLKDFLVVRS